MKHLLDAGTTSERDIAWFEELADTVARGRAALLARQDARGSWSADRDANEAVRDTALALVAATDSGAPSDAAVRWLLSADAGPDVGATARVLVALARSGNAARERCFATVHRAINFLLAAQNRDGGWPEFDRGVKADPSCQALTALVLEALGHFGFRVGQPPVDAAVAFVLGRQEISSSWRNLCGTDPLRATWQVIAGLVAVGFDVFALPLRRAVRWLKESQNEDGGWGGSTASETASALLALLAAQEGASVEVRAGAEFLVGTQHANGTWSEDALTGSALMALGRYLSERTAPARKVFVRTDAGHRASGPRAHRHTLAEM